MTDTQGTDRTFLIRRRFADGDEYLVEPYTWQRSSVDAPWEGAAEYAGVDEAVNTARQHGDGVVELIDGGRIEVVELIDGEPGPAMWAMGAAMPDLDVACAEQSIFEGADLMVEFAGGGGASGAVTEVLVAGERWLRVDSERVTHTPWFVNPRHVVMIHPVSS